MRKNGLIWIGLLIVLLFSGCGEGRTTDGGEKSDPTEAHIETAGIQYPIMLTDQAGRELVIEKRPERIVSSYYITTSAFLALDLMDETVGIESDPGRRPIYELCSSEILEKTQVGSPKEFDLEVCASLQPDLVVLPMRAKNMVDPLEELGITVMVVNPESQDDIFEMLLLIGKAMDKEQRAQELVSYIKDKTEYLKEVLKDNDRPSVYLSGNSSFLSTASKGMYQNDLISIGGGENVAGNIDDTYWIESSYEQILTWNPDVIVLASDAKYSKEEILNDENLSACEAIADGFVYQIPSQLESWDSPVPGSFLGAVYLASVLHPDLVTEEYYENMVEEYYEKFYGFSYAKN